MRRCVAARCCAARRIDITRIGWRIKNDGAHQERREPVGHQVAPPAKDRRNRHEPALSFTMSHALPLRTSSSDLLPLISSASALYV